MRNKKVTRACIIFLLTFCIISAQDYQPGFLSSLEEEIIKELNLARTNPKQYAAHLVKFRKSFDGNQINYSFEQYEYVSEGVATVDEAIQFLHSQKSLPPLRKSKGMRLGARDLGRDQSLKNTTGHRASDGSYVQDRVNRYGEWKRALGENLCYGKDSARLVVMTLIIDDGIKNRGHRKNIFSPEYSVVGVYCDTHRRYEILTVITFAGDYIEKNKK